MTTVTGTPITNTWREELSSPIEAFSSKPSKKFKGINAKKPITQDTVSLSGKPKATPLTQATREAKINELVDGGWDYAAAQEEVDKALAKKQAKNIAKKTGKKASLKNKKVSKKTVKTAKSAGKKATAKAGKTITEKAGKTITDKATDAAKKAGKTITDNAAKAKTFIGKHPVGVALGALAAAIGGFMVLSGNDKTENKKDAA